MLEFEILTRYNQVLHNIIAFRSDFIRLYFLILGTL
jgi:hypothetical protein